MATRQQLKARWETPEGQQKVQALYQTFGTNTTSEQLHAIVASLPYVDEVAPDLDLRGLQINKNIFVRHLNLPGVRLNYSSLRGIISDGTWAHAVFDDANVSQLSFHVDLTEASFVNANARKARFAQSILSRANFSGAKLIGAQLDDALCNEANFSGADLREAVCTKSDFRGANLSGANLSNATLGSILFDLSTKTAGANFAGAAMSKDFRAFVSEHGETPKPADDTEAELATIKATIAFVQEQVNSGNIERSQAEPVLATLNTILQRMASDPHYDWEAFVESLPPNDKTLFYAAYEEGMGNYEYYM
ncbi:MAG TPA: pentapeptide repeat-containing protein [Ktedonobacteraceae bacterium]|nr:pentapeptide repeat-containing protein [Ktedonobacteraceae bacterium]